MADSEGVQELTVQIEEQLRVDDDVLTAKLPARKSNRNRVIRDSSTKGSLPERHSNKSRTVFAKSKSYINDFPARSLSTDESDKQPAEIRRAKTVK